jgi:hypothetical protein
VPARLIVHEDHGSVRAKLQREGVVVPGLGHAEPFEPPLRSKELEELRYYLEDYLTAPFGVDEERGARAKRTLPTWGTRLFESLSLDVVARRDEYERAIEAGRSELWFSSNSARCVVHRASVPTDVMPRPTGLEADPPGAGRRPMRKP